MKVTITNPSGESIEADGDLDSTYILYRDIDGIESPSYMNSTDTTAFSDGANYYGSYADPREISLRILINAGSYAQMWNNGARRDLIKVLNPKNGELSFVFELDDGTQYQINTTLNGKPSIKQNDFQPDYAICNIDLICFDPWFKDNTQTVQEISLSTGGFKLPFSLPLNLGTYGYDILTNDGDIAAPCVIVINGPITNPTIENETTGESIIITKTLVAGERLVIDTDYKTPYVRYYNTDGDYTNLFSAIDIDSVFFKLQPGANTIKLTDTEDLTGSTFVFAWYDRYSGV